MYFIQEKMQLSCFHYFYFLKAKAAEEVTKDGILLPVKHSFQLKHLLLT